MSEESVFGVYQECVHFATHVEEVREVQPGVTGKANGCSGGQEERSSRCVVTVVDEESVLPRASVELVDGNQSLVDGLLVEVATDTGGAIEEPQEGN